jgi:hypothetical protein
VRLAGENVRHGLATWRERAQGHSDFHERACSSQGATAKIIRARTVVEWTAEHLFPAEHVLEALRDWSQSHAPSPCTRTTILRNAIASRNMAGFSSWCLRTSVALPPENCTGDHRYCALDATMQQSPNCIDWVLSGFDTAEQSASRVSSADL